MRHHGAGEVLVLHGGQHREPPGDVDSGTAGVGGQRVLPQRAAILGGDAAAVGEAPRPILHGVVVDQEVVQQRDPARSPPTTPPSNLMSRSMPTTSKQRAGSASSAAAGSSATDSRVSSSPSTVPPLRRPSTRWRLQRARCSANGPENGSTISPTIGTE